MIYTPSTVFGSELIQNLSPWMTQLWQGWYADAIGTTFAQMMELTAQTGFDGDVDYVPPYGVVFNPTTTPVDFIPYVSQFEGQPIPAGSTDDEARNLLLTAPNRQRGNSATVMAALVPRLVTTQSLAVRNRIRPDGSPDANWFLVFLRPEAVLWNLIENGSFEHDTLGGSPAAWEAGTATVTNVWSADGRQSLAVVTTATTVATPSVVPGFTYTGSVVVNCTATTIFSFGWLDSSMTPISNSDVVASPGISTLSLTAVAPTNAAYIQVELDSSHAFMFDALVVQQNTEIPAYVDGDKLGYSWAGTAGDSQTTVIPQLLADVQAVLPAGLQWPADIAVYNEMVSAGTSPLILTDFNTWAEATGDWSAETITWSQTATSSL